MEQINDSISAQNYYGSKQYNSSENIRSVNSVASMASLHSSPPAFKTPLKPRKNLIWEKEKKKQSPSIPEKIHYKNYLSDSRIRAQPSDRRSPELDSKGMNFTEKSGMMKEHIKLLDERY